MPAVTADSIKGRRALFCGNSKSKQSDYNPLRTAAAVR